MLLLILLLALMFFVGIYLIDHDFRLAGSVWLAVSIVIGVAVYEAPRIRVRRALRHTPSALGERTIVLDQRGTVSVFPTGKIELEWRAYTKYSETKDAFLLFVSPFQYTLIPKRALSASQAEELRMLLSDKVPMPKSRK